MPTASAHRGSHNKISNSRPALAPEVVSDLAKREDEVKRQFRAQGVDLRLNERVSVVISKKCLLYIEYNLIATLQVNKKVDLCLRPQYKFTR